MEKGAIQHGDRRTSTPSPISLAARDDYRFSLGRFPCRVRKPSSRRSTIGGIDNVYIARISEPRTRVRCIARLGIAHFEEDRVDRANVSRHLELLDVRPEVALGPLPHARRAILGVAVECLGALGHAGLGAGADFTLDAN
jgi:hypothetical protein